MTLKLYNTMSRQIEEFEPFKPNTVGLYACGLTVYDYTHLGHLRKYTLDDVLLRVLRHAGYQVTFVQNVTDVGHLASDADTGEDKLEKGAKKYGKSAWDIAREFEAYFWRSMDLMGNLRPDHSTRATDHIQEQLELVKQLEDQGFTYVIDGDGVYFDTSKLEDYGKLARLDLEQQQAGARVSAAGKKNPTDFALWKFERPGENRAMVWPSPWAERSFPGWHIECSAMSMQYLGEQFDIHTGGIDHIPVHHTNEIAQAEAATGKKPFVKYWVHHNFLLVNGEKMSKSLGNFFTIDDVLERGFSPQVLRLLLLTSHYRSEMNFTWENLAGMQHTWDKLLTKVAALQEQASTSSGDDEQVAKYRQELWGYLYQDLHTPEAIALMWQVLKTDDLTASQKLELLADFDELLGLRILESVADQVSHQGTEVAVPAAIQDLLDQRAQARASHNWAQADQLRDQLQAQGYLVQDTPQGQVVEPST